MQESTRDMFSTLTLDKKQEIIQKSEIAKKLKAMAQEQNGDGKEVSKDGKNEKVNGK